MSKTNPNDPAFPVDDIHHPFYGVTKREYLAATALQGLLSCIGVKGTICNRVDDAVKYADALIDELNKEKETE